MTTTEPRKTMNGKPVFTVPAKTIINFDSGFKEKLLCDGPTFTAGTSCPYSCSFCYVPAQMLKQTPWLEKHGVNGKHEAVVIRRENAVEIARKQLESHSKADRMTKKVIYASPLTDVAANMELVRETVEICKVILELTNWDIRLLSKSNLLPKVALELQLNDIHVGDPMISQKRVIYGVSTGTLDDKIAAAFESGTPKVSKRIESLHWLQDNGFRTFGMICPSLPSTEPGGYTPWAKAMFDAIRGERCESIWTEVINLRGESFTRTEKCLRDVGENRMADVLRIVSFDKKQWEQYARATFEAHASVTNGQKSPDGSPKLKHLQYVSKDSTPYWESQIKNGAVLL